MNSTELQTIIQNFMNTQSGSFSLVELYETLTKKVKELSLDELQHACETSKSLNLIHHYGETGIDRYISRPQLFNGAEFCVKPTALELEQKILFAGHRFMPFCNQNITPGNIILQNINKETIDRKDFQIELTDAAIFHSLFGRLGMLGIYTFDNAQNAIAIEDLGFDAKLTLPVFDMGNFFTENNIDTDDQLVVEVINWKAGLTRIKRINRASEQTNKFAEITDWIEAFNGSLGDVCQDFGVATTAELQLERTFAQMPKLLHNPTVHIGGAIALGHQVAIQDIGGNCILWDANEDPEEKLSLADYNNEPYDNSEEPLIDQIMIEHGIPYSSGELEAMVRNEFFSKGDVDINFLLDTYFSSFYQELDKAILSEIIKFFSETYADVKDTYNIFADNNAGKLRAELIRVKMKMVNWLVELESQISDINQLPTKKVLQFSEIMSYVTQSLTMCNNTDNVITADELKVNMGRLEELDEHVCYLMDDIAQFEDEK